MKNDIDKLMQDQNLDTLMVIGAGQHNPPMVYLTGGAHLTQALLVKRRGTEPILLHSSMERDEAAGAGLNTRDLADFRYPELLTQHNGDQLKATVALYRLILEDLGADTGRMVIYGQGDAGNTYAIFSELQSAIPGLKIVGEFQHSLLLNAMATKDTSEVERIRQVGKITTHVVGQVADFLTSHKVNSDGELVNFDGKPLTIAQVKRRINLWLAEQGAENPEGTIFAIGADAGVPHSSGTPGDRLILGTTIIFDIFPCEPGGGYYYDFTRTWCLGYAPDEVMALYEDVHTVYKQIMSEIRINTPCKPYQIRTCELFEARGHKTINSETNTQEGYVHSLGHGLGLHVHERPWFGVNATDADRIEPGVVVTIEPGLYYPQRGMGVRLEDTVWARPDGQMEILVEYPHDLVLPMS